MNYNDIVTYVTDKVGETDDYSQSKCLSFAKARHRLIYESFDWTAAQDTLSVQVTVSGGDGAQIESVVQGADIVHPPPPPPQPPPIPPRPPPLPPPPPPGQGGGSNDIPVDCEKVISARFDGEFLDPVTPNYIFESHPEMFLDSGKPQFYWSRYLSDQQSSAVRLFPAPEADGTLELLVKRRFDDSAGDLLIPNIEDTILCFVLADMWEYLRQLGIYDQKLKEAQALLAAAQQRDVPSTPKPRMSKNLTSSGETLAEMTDEVCDIIGRWEPDIRESVRDRIRRNYAQTWDTLMLPESLIIANVPIDISQEQIVLPPFFDRVIEARLNTIPGAEITGSIFGPIAASTHLKQAEISYFFNVDYTIFERVGSPTNYTMLPSVGVAVLPPFNEGIKVFSSANSSGGILTRHPHNDSPDAGIKVFIKGESAGSEFSEEIEILPGIPPGPGPTIDSDFWNSLASSQYTYDTPLTVSKPETTGAITFYGATSKTELVTLQPKERERKSLRIWLLPNKNPQGTVGNSTTPGNVLVLGKRRVSQLINELDTPQIRNISNALINAAAADMFDRLGNAEQSTKYAAKAAAQIQALVDAETKQNAYQPVISPYVSAYGQSFEELGWY